MSETVHTDNENSNKELRITLGSEVITSLTVQDYLNELQEGDVLYMQRSRSVNNTPAP